MSIRRKQRDFIFGNRDIRKLHNDSNFKEVFAYNLVLLLEKHNITSAELGRKLEVSAPLVQLWRSGALPNEKHFSELCALFEVGYARFFRR